MIIEIDDLSSRNYALLYDQGRFVLFDTAKGECIVDGSFTAPKLIVYLIDELMVAPDDIEGAHGVGLDIERAISTGHSVEFGSFGDVIRNNKYGASGEALTPTQFVTRFFLRGKKAKEQLYRCDICSEAVLITEEHPEWDKFADNGGDQPVSDYCEQCRWEKILTH